jgi:hypothetical protein
VKPRHKIRKAGLSIVSRPDAEKRKRFIAEAKKRAKEFAKQPSRRACDPV